MAEYLAVIVAKGEGTVVAHERLLPAIAAKTLSPRDNTFKSVLLHLL